MSDNRETSRVLNRDSVRLKSFRLYSSSDEDFTKLVNGKLKIQDYKLYKEE